MCLRVGRQDSQFGPILARFSQFWGPEVISMTDEPRGTYMCRSSRLNILANSGPFHALLLIDLVSLNDFHDSRIPGCVYVSVMKNRSFGRFWPVSWTITHHFGVPKRFSWLSNPKVCICVGCQDSQFGPILARFLDYYLVLGSRSDFHD